MANWLIAHTDSLSAQRRHQTLIPSLPAPHTPLPHLLDVVHDPFMTPLSRRLPAKDHIALSGLNDSQVSGLARDHSSCKERQNTNRESGENAVQAPTDLRNITPETL